MKILQVVHSLPSINQAGTEIYTFELASELSKRHQVYIFTRYSDLKQRDYLVRKQVSSGITIYLINNTFRDYESFDMLYQNKNIDEKFAQVLDEIKPDIVHIQHLVFLSLGIIEKAKERNIPLVFTLYDYWLMCPKWHLLKRNQVPCEKAADGLFDLECDNCLRDMLHINQRTIRAYYSMKRFFPFHLLKYLKKLYFYFNRSPSSDAIEQLKKRSNVVKKTVENIDFFLAHSQYIKSQFLKFGIPAEKMLLSYPGLKISNFQRIENKVNGKIRFAFIGTIIPAKGLHVLIRAFNEIKNDAAELKIYGKMKDYTGFEGYLQFLLQSIKNKNIKFMDEFRHDSVVTIYKDLDVLVVPSIWQENHPFVIREAFLFKKPVVASRTGGITEMIKDGVNGLLFNAGNSGDLKEKMEYIINNPEILDTFSRNSGSVKDIKDDVQELEEFYGKLSERRVCLGEPYELVK
jgi:glycosyltransferase involved in cell wall biosynthesis